MLRGYWILNYDVCFPIIHGYKEHALILLFTQNFLRQVTLTVGGSKQSMMKNGLCIAISYLLRLLYDFDDQQFI